MPSLIREAAGVLAGLNRLLVQLEAAVSPDPVAPHQAFLQLILKEIKRMSDTFENEMTKLRADVAAQSSVIASATAAFQGLASQLVAAEAAAKNAGATDAQVSAVTKLREQLEANTASLASAIPANTDGTTAPVTSTPVTTTPTDPTAPVTAPVTDPASAAPAGASASSSVPADAPPATTTATPAAAASTAPTP